MKVMQQNVALPRKTRPRFAHLDGGPGGHVASVCDDGYVRRVNEMMKYVAKDATSEIMENCRSLPTAAR